MVTEHISHGPQKKKKGRSHENDIAWKNHTRATDQSRLALATIYQMYRREIGINDWVKYRPELNWRKFTDDLILIIPALKGGLPRRTDGTLVPITPSVVRGRVNNFKHVHKANGTNYWSATDTENPESHEELAKFLPQAKKLVDLFYNEG